MLLSFIVLRRYSGIGAALSCGMLRTAKIYALKHYDSSILTLTRHGWYISAYNELIYVFVTGIFFSARHQVSATLFSVPRYSILLLWSVRISSTSMTGEYPAR